MCARSFGPSLVEPRLALCLLLFTGQLSTVFDTVDFILFHYFLFACMHPVVAIRGAPVEVLCSHARNRL